MRAIQVDELFAAAKVAMHGPVAWRTPVPEIRSGVYVIAIGDRNLSIDALDLSDRSKWNVGQSIVYIGRAKCLRRRLQQFYRHVYGMPRPHRGGQSILLLSAELQVYWATTDDYAQFEDHMIETFRAEVGAMPFANRVRSARQQRRQPLPR